jgi:hypothetical protein
MKRKTDRQANDAPEGELQSMPIHSISLTSGKTLARAPTERTSPDQARERNDNRHYARHWGINE